MRILITVATKGAVKVLNFRPPIWIFIKSDKRLNLRVPKFKGNIESNQYFFLQNFPPQSQVALGKQKLYRTSLWVKQNEQITFWVNFPNGSHINLNWTIVDPLNQVKIHA